MSRNNIEMSRIECCNSMLWRFLDMLPTDEMYTEYFQGTDKGNEDMQDFINSHLIQDAQWMTGIGVMDAMDMIVNDARGNGNVNFTLNTSNGTEISEPVQKLAPIKFDGVTFGGMKVSNFQILLTPIERGQFSDLIYGGDVEGYDGVIYWDELGKCANGDCQEYFINPMDFLPEINLISMKTSPFFDQVTQMTSEYPRMIIELSKIEKERLKI